MRCCWFASAVALLLIREETRGTREEVTRGLEPMVTVEVERVCWKLDRQTES